jgi:long-chain acyl-CoA synthetase
MDDSGFLTIVDRIKEVVITGGFNVYPSEVEAVLRRLEGVVDAAVVGLPHEDGSEQLVAAVVLAPGTVLHPDELHDHARASLTAYKVPRRYVVVDALPVNAMGKVQRREVVRALQER